jgi:hypothetical protein
MDPRRSLMMAAVLIAAAAAIGVWAYAILPPDAAVPLLLAAGVSNKGEALAVAPALGAGLLAILAVATRPGPSAPGRSGAGGLALVGLAALCLVAEAALAASAIAPQVDALRWLVLAAAVLLVLGGYAIQRLIPPPVAGQGPDAGAAFRSRLRARRVIGRATTISGVAVAAVVSLSSDRAFWFAALIGAAATPLIASRLAARLRET